MTEDFDEEEQDKVTHPVTWDYVNHESGWMARCHVCIGDAWPCDLHIEPFFKERWDVAFQPLPERAQITVPLFFSRQKMLGNVPRVQKRGRSVLVNVGYRDEYENLPFMLAHPEGVEKETIDYVSKSSGVWAMRNSLLQYLFAKYKTVPPCRNPHHPKGASFAEDDPRIMDATQPAILIRVLDLLEHEECTHCWERDGKGGAFSQLVPDPEEKI